MMKKVLRLIPVGVPSLVAVLVTAYFSLDANPLGEESLFSFPGSDKVAHIILYFFITCVFILDYAKFRLPHHTRVNLELLFMCCAMLLGLLLEAAQLILSNGRSYETLDIVANCVGAVAAFAYLRWRGLHKFRRMMLTSGKHHRHHLR